MALALVRLQCIILHLFPWNVPIVHFREAVISRLLRYFDRNSMKILFLLRHSRSFQRDRKSSSRSIPQSIFIYEYVECRMLLTWASYFFQVSKHFPKNFFLEKKNWILQSDSHLLVVVDCVVDVVVVGVVRVVVVVVVVEGVVDSVVVVDVVVAGVVVVTGKKRILMGSVCSYSECFLKNYTETSDPFSHYHHFLTNESVKTVYQLISDFLPNLPVVGAAVVVVIGMHFTSFCGRHICASVSKYCPGLQCITVDDPLLQRMKLSQVPGTRIDICPYGEQREQSTDCAWVQPLMPSNKKGGGQSLAYARPFAQTKYELQPRGCRMKELFGTFSHTFDRSASIPTELNIKTKLKTIPNLWSPILTRTRRVISERKTKYIEYERVDAKF